MRPKSSSISFLNSIKRKLIFAFLGVSLVPLIVVSLLSSSEFQNDLRKSIGEYFLVIANLVKDDSENWVAERKKDIETLASLARVRSMDPDQATQAVQEYATLWQIYETVFVADLNGDTIAVSSGNRVNVKDRAYFQQAIQGKTTISELIISRASGNPVIVDGKIALEIQYNFQSNNCLRPNISVVQMSPNS